jgi:hypothetical protein
MGTIKVVAEEAAYSPSVSFLFAVHPRRLTAPRMTDGFEKYYNRTCSTVKQPSDF